MTELKTLKDFRTSTNAEYTRGEEPGTYSKKIFWHSVSVEELKQEAVEWVKFQKDIQIHNPEHFNEYRLNILWIKTFFNLTEEELA